MKNKHKDIFRLCVACRNKKNKYDLIRIVKEKNGRIFVDDLNKAQGRGAYLCWDFKCYKILKKKKALEKSFKCKVKREIYNELESKIYSFENG